GTRASGAGKTHWLASAACGWPGNSAEHCKTLFKLLDIISDRIHCNTNGPMLHQSVSQCDNGIPISPNSWPGSEPPGQEPKLQQQSPRTRGAQASLSPAGAQVFHRPGPEERRPCPSPGEASSGITAQRECRRRRSHCQTGENR